MLFDHDQILRVLPHRDPILLVDKILEMHEGKDITGSFYVDPALPVLAGHFPGDPMLPGVYAIEAMCQTASFLLMSIPEYKGRKPIFLGINRASFKKMIRPKDTVILHADIVGVKKSKDIMTVDCTCHVNDTLCADCNAAIIMK